MKILVESHIPYIKGLLEPFAEIEYLEPQDFTHEKVADADALIIRTRTRCDAELLHGSRCKFIGTATIGTDHIDLNYCRNNGIKVCNAAGCNAPAVAQYVIATIYQHMQAMHIPSPDALSLGVVGVGHVGSIVARFAQECGFKVLLCDPPRAEKEDGDFCHLNHLAKNADIITFHTPLTTDGPHATRHICNEQFLNALDKCSLLINSARGPIIHTEALLNHLRAIENKMKVAIDCWESEPNINAELLQRAFVATPHIAGYSAEGKMRGTAMVIEQINAFFGWQATPPSIPVSTPTLGASHVTLQRIAMSYNPLTDTAMLKSTPEEFENMRNHYNLRHEVESL